MRFSVISENRGEAIWIGDLVSRCLDGLSIPHFLDRHATLAEHLAAASLAPYDVVFAVGATRAQLTDEIAARLGAQGGTCLIWLADTPAHAMAAYALGFVHYLLMPVTYRDIHTAVTRCLRLIPPVAAREPRYLEVVCGRRRMPVRIEDIYYFEVHDKIVSIYTASAVIQTKASLDSLAGQLDPARFIRPHRSFIVSLDYIASLRGPALTLRNGAEVSLGRKYRKAVFDAYERHIAPLLYAGHTAAHK